MSLFFSEWLANQSNIAGTLNTLAQFSIRLLGTNDVEHFDSKKKLAELLLKQDEQFISAIVSILSNQTVYDNNLILHNSRNDIEPHIDNQVKVASTLEEGIIKQEESKDVNKEINEKKISFDSICQAIKDQIGIRILYALFSSEKI
jgi:UTP-glucose-1-phosphate uridylyltransferase